jgi:CRISPR-associated endonuclease/helicase Cas3
MSSPPPYFAHSGAQANFQDWQKLAEHLRQVAYLAKRFAHEAAPNDPLFAVSVFAAGMLHDLGKYRPEFQDRLHDRPVQREKTFHKQAGAAKAYQVRHVPVAFAIAGHHGGMPDQAALKSAVKSDSGEPTLQSVWPTAIVDCPDLANLALKPPVLTNSLHGEFFTRLVFSCLVDADWTDTGEHERQVHRRPPEPLPPRLEAATRLTRVLEFIQGRAAVCKDANIARIRKEILHSSIAMAAEKPGLFSLTVPTGGGKTLSALAFALKHAAEHGLRRVIYVAPYLSILDQNARVIRQALGLDGGSLHVFEHHSLSEPPGDDDQNDLERGSAARRAENWDSPLIVTTNVQFFESLFSNKPGRCRKLHNIARSVVILDECQTLPPELVAPTCSMLGQLTGLLGCSIVLCTATQPAFDHTDMQERLTGVREMIPENLDLFARLRRVELTWPARGDSLNWLTVASHMARERAALCIVNSRRAARELFAALKDQVGEATFHLSTSMCPAHRLAVLDAVKTRLDQKQPCFLVSTQLIEAGVDIDFPMVLREMGPLEAIIQAAGRCNREGLLNAPDGSPGGRVLVFRSAAALAEPAKYYPPDRWYKAGRDVVETAFLNAGRRPSIDSPQDIREYFERLYRTGTLDAHCLQTLRERGDFDSVARHYRLIDDDGVPVVVTTWEAQRDEISALLDEVKQRPSRIAFRRLAPFQVNLRRHELAKLVYLLGEERWGIQTWNGVYDCDLGLQPECSDALLVV